jgi:hypothetical protein
MTLRRITRRLPLRLALLAGFAASGVAAARADDDRRAFLPRAEASSTIPANGDLNPYGVAFVADGFPAGGLIAPGDVLVSNFNNINNLQGTGVTIIRLTPNGVIAPGVAPGSAGNAAVFFTSRLTGLSTALGVLRGGFVIVGNVPTTDGTSATIAQGSLQIVDRTGKLVKTLNDSAFLDSPWDLTINDKGGYAQVFVSNVLTGTVSRLDVLVGASTVTVLHKAEIASGYAHQPNAAALVLGPTGLAYDGDADVLYVASTADNAIFAVPFASRAQSPVTKGKQVFADPHLRGPLALAFAPNGDLVTANGDAVNGDPTHPSEIIEFTRSGAFVREFDIDASQGGSFGLATVLGENPPFNFAAVDDVPNIVWVARLGAR